MTPVGAVVRGLAAGVAGTAVMTASQEGVSRLRGSSGGSDGPRSWDDAAAPAKVARKVLEGVFGSAQPASRIPLLTNAMHWGYGIAWGAAYGLVRGSVRVHPVIGGALFGTGVWAVSYVELVPMGLYAPPWEYPPEELALDLSYHLAYGLGVAAAFHAVTGDE